VRNVTGCGWSARGISCGLARKIGLEYIQILLFTVRDIVEIVLVDLEVLILL
jgi:hypothetical protein